MFEGDGSLQVALPVFQGGAGRRPLRGKCEVCPPQDELNLSRSEEAEQNNLKRIYSDGREARSLLDNNFFCFIMEYGG